MRKIVVGIEVILIFEDSVEGTIDIYDESADFERMEYDEDYRQDIYSSAIRKALQTLPESVCKMVVDTDIATFWEMNC